MKAILKQAIFFLAISIVVNYICVLLQSCFLIDFIKGKIIEIQITLMAINTATSSVIVSKIEDLSKRLNHNFDKTINQVRISIIEQIVLIAVSVFLLIFYNSPVIQEKFPQYYLFFNVALITVFIYSLDILKDTGLAIFNIIKYSKSKE